MHSHLAAWIGLLLMMETGIASAHGDLHERISQVTVEIHDAPTAGLFFRRGCLHLEHGEAAAALEDFLEADRLSPGEFETDPLRAEGLMLLGKYPPALETLNRYLDRHPADSRCLVLRARVHGQMGKPDAAIRDYRKALSLTRQPEPDLLLEISNALAENDQSAEALQVLDQGIARLGLLPSLVTPAIELDLRNGNPDAALLRIDRMQTAVKRPEPWMACRASVLARSGRISESRDAWQSLLGHIAALPSVERTSHAMCSRAREAREALAALESNPR